MRTLFFFLFFIPFVCFSQNISYDEGDKLKNDLGINLGVITYSYRNMPDQSPLAILEYVKQSGIYNIELWGKHAEPFAGSPISPFDDPVNRRVLSKQSRKIKLTDEEKKIVSKFRKEMKIYNEKVSQWRKSVSMIKFKELRKLYNEAGIKIYAFKPRVFEKDNTDDDIRYGMRAAKALGASHVTLEHPSDDEHTARLGKIAEEEDILVGYHGHLQQTPVFWDKAISQSNSNQINLDLGHYVAAENPDPLGFIVDKHDKIISMHLKDRQKLSNGGLNLIWGKGDTPITEVVQLIKKNGYDFYLTIELEHDITDGSDDLKEVKRCLAYIKKALE